MKTEKEMKKQQQELLTMLVKQMWPIVKKSRKFGHSDSWAVCFMINGLARAILSYGSENPIEKLKAILDSVAQAANGALPDISAEEIGKELFDNNYSKNKDETIH